MKEPLFWVDEGGRGDDIMLFWAAVAAVSDGIFKQPIRFFFKQAETRTFLAYLSQTFPEIDIVEDPSRWKNVIYLRSGYTLLEPMSWMTLARKRLRSSKVYCDTFYHHYAAAYGETRRPSRRQKIMMTLGLLRVWTPLCPAIYVGLQQLSIACGWSKRYAQSLTRRLPDLWPVIRSRVYQDHAGTRQWSVLFLPTGSSFQDFDESFISCITEIVPQLRIVRYIKDNRPADLRFETITELWHLMCNADLVVTNDSLPSHLAYFCTRRHVLICSRVDPMQCCFPGAGNTTIVDLGANLICRPCAYLPLSKGVCAAGYSRCRVQLEITDSQRSTLIRAIKGNPEQNGGKDK